MRRVAGYLVLLALLLYIPGIWWGLPYATAADRTHAWGNDEIAPLGPLAELYAVAKHSPTFNPQYPLLHYLFEASLVAPYAGLLKVTGGLGDASVVYPFGLSDPVQALMVMTLLARAVNIAAAAGVVLAAWRTGSRMWNPLTGMLAACCCLLLYPMFYFSRTSNVDMGAVFWTAWGIAIAAECWKDRLTVKRAALLGLLAACATATKDQSYAAFLPLGAGILVREFQVRRKKSGQWLELWKAAAAGVACGSAVYVLASGSIFHLERYRMHVHFIVNATRPVLSEGFFSLLRETGERIVDSLGAPMAVAAAAGIWFCARKSKAGLLFLLPVLGVICGTILPIKYVEFRYVFLVAYPLALYAGYALAEVLSDARSWVHGVGTAAAVLVYGWALLRGTDLTYQMINDSRYEAGRWLKENVRAGDTIGYYGAPVKLPAIEAGIETLVMPNQTRRIPGKQATTPPDFVLVIPQQVFEAVHEHTMPEATYQSLVDGSMNYQRVQILQAPTLFRERPVTFVNPRVEIYVRRDRLRASGG